MKQHVRPRRGWLAAYLAIAAVAVTAGSGLAIAQAYTPPPPPLTTLPRCPQSPADAERAKKLAKEGECDPTNVPAPQLQAPAAAPANDAFPFPGDAKKPQTPAAQAFPFPGSDPNTGSNPNADPNAASPTAGTTPSTPAAKQYPYPGADSAGAMPSEDGTPAAPAPSREGSPSETKPATGNDSGRRPGSAPSSKDASNGPASKDPNSSSNADSSSNNSSSSSSDSSSNSSSDSSSSSTSSSADSDSTAQPQPKLIDKGSHGRKSRHGQSDSDRVDEDLSVAHFYLQSGNLMGAYLRAQDAVKTQPDYAPGHFALGEASARLGHRSEAQAEFHEYLKLEPDGQKAKDAERELSKLN